MKTSILFLALLSLCADARPSLGKRDWAPAVKETFTAPRPWIRISDAPQDQLIALRIGLKQANEDALLEDLYAVSDPSSARYGKHLSQQEVLAHIAPSQDTVSAAHDWLFSHGINPAHGGMSEGQDWIHLSLPVSVAERLLDTKYSLYEHRVTGDTVVRTEQYSLPQFLHEHVDLVTPTTYFPGTKALRSQLKYSKNTHVNSDDQAPLYVDGLCNTSLVTLECLRTFYGTVNYEPKCSDRNSIFVTGYLNETAIRSDLQLYLADEKPSAEGYYFHEQNVNGGNNRQTLTASDLANGTGIEANLDMQTVVGFTYPTPVTFVSTGGVAQEFKPDLLTPTDTNEPYIDFINYALSLSLLPGVITTSYDDDEQTVPYFYAKRVCSGFAQMGARGSSLLFASGDSGVGPDGDCFTNDGTMTPTFLPEFPSTCPYVTSVGATKNFAPEVAANDTNPQFTFYSGGGFSNYFPRPDYQKYPVEGYLAKIGNLHKGLYNASGRAIPDVAAQGQDFKIYWNGTDLPVDGTSASTPLFSSVVTLINDHLMSQNKSTLGFLNPLLYSKGYKALNDITSGASQGCNTTGFPAAEGWDAVTGFGTPNFSKMLQYWCTSS